MSNPNQRSEQLIAYLRQLYEKTGGIENKPISTEAIRTVLGLDAKAAASIESYLQSDGLIDLPARGAVSLTHAGALQIEASKPDAGEERAASSAVQSNFEHRYNRMPADVIQRLRSRRPGYDAVLGLVRKYESLGANERQLLEEYDLVQQYVVPLFKAVGWGAAKVGLQPTGKFFVDLVLDYDDLHIPVEVKRYVNQLGAQAQSDLVEAASASHLDYGFLTNFDQIQAFAMQPMTLPLTGAQQAPDVPLFETGPVKYLTDEDTTHDLIAAPIFYDRIANRREQSDDSNNANTASKTSKVEVASRAVADSPSPIDLLGFTDYADALADLIKNERTGKPLTIGIDAPWGMGKTTLMRMIQDRLAVQEGKRLRSFPTVWFNAWAFDQTDATWAALTLSILKEVRAKLTLGQRFSLWARVYWRQADKVLLVSRILRGLVVLLFVTSMGITALYLAQAGLMSALPDPLQKLLNSTLAIGGIGLLIIAVLVGIQVSQPLLKTFDIKIVEFVNGPPRYQERVNFLNKFQTDFREIAKLFTENGKLPIVVFIDDLERAAPPRPAEIMEGINLFLGSPFTVFVIGMDARMVAGSIEGKYAELKEFLADEDEPGGLRLGQRFLEKIIQVNFRIPRADTQAFENFIRDNVSGVPAPTPPPRRNQVIEVEGLIQEQQATGKSLEQAVQTIVAERPGLDAAVIHEARREVFAQSLDDSPEFRATINLAARYVGFNPRIFKRFLNNFRLMALIYNRRGLFDGGILQLSILAKWTIISTRWPDVNDAVNADPKFFGLLANAFKMHDQMRKLQALPNSVKEVSALQEQFAVYLENRYIKRLVDSDSLKALLEKMSEAELESLAMYPNYRISRAL
jgi:KAP family P-loop domain